MDEPEQQGGAQHQRERHHPATTDAIGQHSTHHPADGPDASKQKHRRASRDDGAAALMQQQGQERLVP